MEARVNRRLRLRRSDPHQPRNRSRHRNRPRRVRRRRPRVDQGRDAAWIAPSRSQPSARACASARRMVRVRRTWHERHPELRLVE